MRKLLSASEYLIKPWKNGQGTTQEIIVWPPDSSEKFIWRMSLADLKESGAFSLYPEYNRILVLIEGAPIGLDQSGSHIELPLLTPLSFDGAINTYAHVKSPGMDFNLMLKKEIASGLVTIGIGKKEFEIQSHFFAVLNLEDHSLMLWEDEKGKTITVDGLSRYLIIEIDV